MELEVWQIILIVLGVLLAIYLIIVLTDLMFVLSFHSLLRKHRVALNVLLQTKYDNIKVLSDLLKKYDSNYDPKYQEILDSIDIKHLSDLHTKESAKVRLQLVYLRDELMYIADKDENFGKNEEFKRAKQHIADLDQIYYAQVATYNADIIGYNYWIRFIPTRYIFNILKIKKKDLIS